MAVNKIGLAESFQGSSGDEMGSGSGADIGSETVSEALVTLKLSRAFGAVV